MIYVSKSKQARTYHSRQDCNTGLGNFTGVPDDSVPVLESIGYNLCRICLAADTPIVHSDDETFLISQLSELSELALDLNMEIKLHEYVAKNKGARVFWRSFPKNLLINMKDMYRPYAAVAEYNGATKCPTCEGEGRTWPNDNFYGWPTICSQCKGACTVTPELESEV